MCIRDSSSAGWFESGLSGAADVVWMKRVNTTGHTVMWHKNLTDQDGGILMNSNGIQDGLAGAGNNWGGSSGDGDPNVGHGRGGNPKIGTGTWSDSGGTTGTYVCYAWKGVAGVSSFGGYAGGTYNTNTSACGFKPRLIIIKLIDVATAAWNITDTFRGYTAYGGSGNYMYWNGTSQEDANSNYGVEPVTNGFHLGGSDTINGSGKNYIYLAFA